MRRASVPFVPKDPSGPLRVLVIGRISTVHQDMENIQASYRYVQEYLQQVYPGPKHIKQLGEQASGMLTDRATIREAEDEIARGTWDLVITEDLARFYRNPRYQFAFVQDAVDSGTRVICIGDHIDTADENWEVSLSAAALRHGLHIPDTRRRVRRTATHAFHKGGMVLRVRFGYRKLTKEEAESGQHGPKGLRIAKLPDCTPIIQAMRTRVLQGDHYEAVADWLNELGIPPGPYVQTRRWEGRLVEDLLRNPILSGTRTFRDIVYEPIFKTGRHRRRKNADGPETEHCLELAHLSEQEHQQLLEVMDQRAAQRVHASGPEHPLYGKPRSRSIWPAKHARCGICGGLMYRSDRDQLKCQNTRESGGNQCWNHVQVPCQLTRDKILDWLLGYCEQFPGFRAALVDAAWAELEAQVRRKEQTRGTVEQEIGDLEKQASHLARAIAKGGQMEALLQTLDEVNQALKAAKTRRADQTKQQAPTLANLASRQEVEVQLAAALREVARNSHEFADLMRRIIPEFVIQPVQALDSGQVRPRACFTVQLTAVSNPVPSSSNEPANGLAVGLDLFDPPLHVQSMARCVAEKAAHPELSLRKLASRLGLNYMTVKRALAYARKMEEAGLCDPYRVLTSCPANAARWKSRGGSNLAS